MKFLKKIFFRKKCIITELENAEEIYANSEGGNYCQD